MRETHSADDIRIHTQSNDIRRGIEYGVDEAGGVLLGGRPRGLPPFSPVGDLTFLSGICRGDDYFSPRCHFRVGALSAGNL